MRTDQDKSIKMQNSIDNQERRPLSKLLLIGAILALIALIVMIVSYVVTSDKKQSNDDEEMVLDFINENSRLSDISSLRSLAGFTEEQFNKTIDKLNEYFDAKYPDEEYFSLVGEEITKDNLEPEEKNILDTSAEDVSSATTESAERTEGLGKALESEEVEPISETPTSRATVFKLKSSSEKEFVVRVIIGPTSSDVTVKVAESKQDS